MHARRRGVVRPPPGPSCRHDARLRHEAERRGMTVSEVTREAIEAHLGGPRKRRRMLAAGAGASGHDDISERIEEILASEVRASR